MHRQIPRWSVGWVDLAELSARVGCTYQQFIKVADCFPSVRAFAPDVIFAVGLSQLIPRPLLDTARYGCIGFHPTRLPQGRGRAPIAWIVLDKVPAAATFFVMRQGVDDGPVLAQQPFDVDDNDDATSVERKLLHATAQALDALLPQLAQGWVMGAEQDHGQASWYGRRLPEDGLIDWNTPVEDVVRLVRASTRPHPGAFTYMQDTTVTLWQAAMYRHSERGVVGRILHVGSDGSFVVQCGQGLLKAQSWQATQGWQPRVGQRLGYHAELEIHRLRVQIQTLTERTALLESLVRDGLSAKR